MNTPLSLEPCPFCGNSASACENSDLHPDEGRWTICCDRCDSQTCRCATEANAVAVWNRRAALAERPAPKGAIAAFEEAYQRSAEDPSCAGELKIWCEAWSAAAPDAVPAGAIVKRVNEKTGAEKVGPELHEAFRDLPIGTLLYTTPLAAAKQEGRPDWRELCRRLYVELFYCDQQMTHAMNKKGQPMWQTGRIVREVLADARQSLEAFPASPKETRHE